MAIYSVYLLLCSDASLYTGITTDLTRRFQKHLTGRGGAYTRTHRPVRIVYQETFPDRSSALRREAEIKSWSRTAKISRLSLSLHPPPVP